MKVLSTLCIGTILIAAPVTAQPQSSSAAGQSSAHPGARLAERLGLSPEQREQLKSIRSQGTSFQEDREKIQTERQELRDMIDKGQASDEEILAKARTMSQMMMDQNLSRLKRMLAIRKILTPEQREKFKAFIAERRAEHEKEDGGGKGRGDHPFWHMFHGGGPGGGH